MDTLTIQVNAPKFKVGDAVRVYDALHLQKPVGKIVRITGYFADEGAYSIVIEQDKVKISDFNWQYHIHIPVGSHPYYGGSTLVRHNIELDSAAQEA